MHTQFEQEIKLLTKTKKMNQGFSTLQFHMPCFGNCLRVRIILCFQGMSTPEIKEVTEFGRGLDLAGGRGTTTRFHIVI